MVIFAAIIVSIPLLLIVFIIGIDIEERLARHNKIQERIACALEDIGKEIYHQGKK